MSEFDSVFQSLQIFFGFLPTTDGRPAVELKRNGVQITVREILKDSTTGLAPGLLVVIVRADESIERHVLDGVILKYRRVDPVSYVLDVIPDDVQKACFDAPPFMNYEDEDEGEGEEDDEDDGE